jgi:hypothetical protein
MLDMQRSWMETRFKIWITRNEVRGVYWFHIYYLIILAKFINITRAHNGYKFSKSFILGLIGQSTEYLFIIWAGNVTLSKWRYSYMFARHAA